MFTDDERIGSSPDTPETRAARQKADGLCAFGGFLLSIPVDIFLGVIVHFSTIPTSLCVLLALPAWIASYLMCAGVLMYLFNKQPRKRAAEKSKATEQSGKLSQSSGQPEPEIPKPPPSFWATIRKDHVEGCHVEIVGPSGYGKSSLAEEIHGELQTDQRTGLLLIDPSGSSLPSRMPSTKGRAFRKQPRVALVWRSRLRSTAGETLWWKDFTYNSNKFGLLREEMNFAADHTEA